VFDLEKNLMALEKGQADVLAKWHGMDSLFLALENPEPYFITQALFDIIMWQKVNHEDNVFVETDPRSGIQYFLSPIFF
jgi:hypothetical protein